MYKQYTQIAHDVLRTGLFGMNFKPINYTSPNEMWKMLKKLMMNF